MFCFCLDDCPECFVSMKLIFHGLVLGIGFETSEGNCLLSGFALVSGSWFVFVISLSKVWDSCLFVGVVFGIRPSCKGS